METERCLDCTAALWVDAEARRRRPRQRPYDHHRGEFSESGSDGQSASEKSGAELGMRDDTRVRQVARMLPGSLAASTIVSFARQVGYTQAKRELEAAAKVRRPAVSYLDRALLAQAGPRSPVPAERELRTLAETSDALLSGQIMTARDIGQQFRAIEASVFEEADGTLPWSGYASSGRSPDEINRHGNANDLPSAVDPAAPKEKGKSKGKGQSEGGNQKNAGRLE